MSNFVVIEGDNGSGKTTLANLAKHRGFTITSEDEELIAMESEAKQLKGEERIKIFYKYNMQTAQKATANYNETIVVRYWTSTFAASYADGVINESELENQCLQNINKFHLPKAFVYLKCNYKERVRRIIERQAEIGNMGDNCELDRSERYQKAITIAAMMVPVPWLFIPSDIMDEKAILEMFVNFCREI